MSEWMQSANEPRAAPAAESSDDDVLDDIVADCVEGGSGQLAERVSSACEANPRLASAIRRRIESLREVGLLRDAALTDDDRFPERLGDFRLLERLGGGGMGVVFRARQESLGRDVALKLIRPEQLYFPRARDRFQRETEAVARLQHPGIVPIYAVGSQAGVPYFAMELVPACTLATAIEGLRDAAPERLSGRDLQAALQRAAPAWARDSKSATTTVFGASYVDAIVHVVIQVAEALDHAHAREVLHRDVKPSNIAATLDGRALLFDFGLAGFATHERRMTATSTEVGSLHYMAPEQLQGDSRRVGAPADVYALGVTLYELLALQLPYAQDDLLETRRAILEGRRDPLRARNRAVPSDLETVCAKAMEVDPARRYATAEDFAADLRNVLEHRPIRARAPGAVRIAVHWIRRHRASSAAAAAALLGLVGIPSALLLQQSAHTRELTKALDDAHDQRRQAIAARADAETQRSQAQRDASDARAMNRFLVDLFLAVDRGQIFGHEVGARDLLDLGSTRLRTELVEQPTVRAGLMSSIGQSFQSLGEFERAEQLLNESVDLSRSTAGEESLLYAGSLRALAALEDHRGDPVALEHAERALELRRKLDTEQGLDLAETLITYARAAGHAGQFERSERAFREALAIETALPDDLRFERATTLADLADLQVRRSRWDAAIESAREGRDLERAFGVPPSTTTLALLNTTALAYCALGRFDEARPVFDELLELARSLCGETSLRFANYQTSKSNLELLTGHFEEAIEMLEHSKRVCEAAGDAKYDAEDCAQLLGEAYMRAGRWKDARDTLRKLATLFGSSSGALAAWRETMTRVQIVQCDEALGDWAATEDDSTRVLERASDSGSAADDGWEAVAATTLARLLARRGDIAGANELVARARALRDDVNPPGVAKSWVPLTAGVVAQIGGDLERARAELEPLAKLEHGPRFAESVPAIARAHLAVVSGASDAARGRELGELARVELERELGADHPETRALVEWLAGAH